MQFRKDLEGMPPYVPGKLIPGVLKMASNENPLGPSPKAIAALTEGLGRVHIYPEGTSMVLREKLGHLLGVDKDQILVGNGSDELMAMVCLAIMNPGENVVTSQMTFSEYEFSARVAGGTARKAPLKEGTYDLDALAAKADEKTRIFFLCNPNNPTGTYFSHEKLVRFLNTVNPEILVVLDEAYCQYADAPDFPKALELLQKYPNLMIMRTFSKIYGLAALRVGYALASKEIISRVAVVKQPFNVGSLHQEAAAGALDDQGFVEESIRVNQEGKAFLYEEFKKRQIFYYPTQSNFIAFHVKRDAKVVFDAMAKLGVTIRPMGSFGLPEWIRVTVGKREHNELFLKALDGALSQ